MYDFTACIVTYNTPASDLDRKLKYFMSMEKLRINQEN